MAERYVKIFYDWPTTTKKLTYEEKGRLIDAIICYASNQPFELIGNEDYIFPVFQAQIDRDKEKYNDVVQKRRVAGAIGGNQKAANASKCKQDKEEDKDIKTKIEDKDKRHKTKDKEDSLLYIDDARPNLDTVEIYATNNLRSMTPGNMQELASYKEDLPDEVIRHAIDKACEHGAPTWAYTKSILNRYLDEGSKTLGDVLTAEQTRKKQQEEAKQPVYHVSEKWV